MYFDSFQRYKTERCSIFERTGVIGFQIAGRSEVLYRESYGGRELVVCTVNTFII